jgi:hypothetical protein
MGTPYGQDFNQRELNVEFQGVLKTGSERRSENGDARQVNRIRRIKIKLSESIAKTLEFFNRKDKLKRNDVECKQPHKGS